MLVPIEDLKDSLETFDREVQIYPIWLCPFKVRFLVLYFEPV